MPALKNAKHERFAQLLAQGIDQTDAHEQAGFNRNAGNASNLKQKPEIVKRVLELQERITRIEIQATQKAIDKLAVTKEKVVGELAAIGFAKITDVVTWGDSVPLVNPQTGEAVLTKEGDPAVVHNIMLKDSETLPLHVQQAVAEVRRTQSGVTVKMHDKRGALMDLAKLAGWIVEKKEHGAQGDFDGTTDDELLAFVQGAASALGARPAGTREEDAAAELHGTGDAS